MREKRTLEYCKKIAKERGGKCLSTKYINGTTKMRWECKDGHKWNATLDSIVFMNSWCPYCKGINTSIKLKGLKRTPYNKITIDDCIRKASEHNGECLNKIYINSRTKMRWRCKEGHEWDATFASIKYKNSWCPYCSGKRKHSLKECQKIAKEKGGKCLSVEYIDIKTKMRWRCKEGHEWDATFANIKYQNSWCPYCFDNKNRKNKC